MYKSNGLQLIESVSHPFTKITDKYIIVHGYCGVSSSLLNEFYRLSQSVKLFSISPLSELPDQMRRINVLVSRINNYILSMKFYRP